jgi:hypothetical protein
MQTILDILKMAGRFRPILYLKIENPRPSKRNQNGSAEGKSTPAKSEKKQSPKKKAA